MATALANLLLPGVRVHQDPYVLEKGVLDALGPNSYLVSVKVLPSRQSVSEHIPNHGGGPGWDADKLTWLFGHMAPFVDCRRREAGRCRWAVVPRTT